MKKIKVNVIVSFFGQFFTIALGLIIPRFFIQSYGSDVNGLLSTITQVFAYMSLLEAGIGQSARNALYDPISKKDSVKTGKVLSAAFTYFKKFTFFYAIGVVVAATVLPFVLKTNVSYRTIVLIILIEGIANVISFYYIQTPSILLSVDGKSYINNSINLVSKILSYLVRILMAIYGLNILLLQLSYLILNIIKVVIYRRYFNIKYPTLMVSRKGDTNLLKDRNSYVLTEISSTVFNSTDMIILSVFLSTQIASVYSVYNMIYSNIALVLDTVYFSIFYLLGNTYHKSIEEYKKMHDSFQSVFIGMITILMSVCYCLVIPFVKLYTSGISDINYIYESLPIMFCLIQILSWSRYVSGNLTGVAGFAKQTSYVSLLEAVLNLSLSILFVKKFGIIGVTFATMIALPFKVIWCIYIADKKVMHRSCLKTVLIICVNLAFFFSVVVLSRLYQPLITSYGQFLLWGFVYTIIFGIVGMGLNFLVNKDCWQVIRRYILKR